METNITDELTFGFWNGKPGLAFSDICLAAEMHFDKKEKKRKGLEEFNCGMTVHCGPISGSLDSLSNAK